MNKVTHSINVPDVGTINIEIDNEPNRVFFDVPEGTNTRRTFLHNPLTNRNLFKLSFPHYTKLLDGNGDEIESAGTGMSYEADVIDETKYRQFSEMNALPPGMEICDLQLRASVNHLLLHKYNVIAFDPENGYAPL